MTVGESDLRSDGPTLGSLANWFLSRRLQLRITQREIACRLRMTPATIWNWERDKTAPDLRRADSIASAYEVTPAEAVEQIVSAVKRVGANGGVRAD